ncbi:hypothetical protein LCGC14_0612890 [marine sediment metagenome]|uniref:TOTE conflict system primase domain-containing protein n=1 Tax=marine sediment metagenome TaxID=412755 RepID=A0A0F9RRC9_9ZZZZ
MEKLAKLMYRLFKGRRDTWAVRRGDEYFRVTGKEMTIETYKTHLTGPNIGIYPLLSTGEACYVAAIDIDKNDLELVKRAQELLPKPNYVERSRSGNFHIWMFFKEPVVIDNLSIACRKALTLLRKECDEHCNLYPLSATNLGLLIAIPLQKGFVEQGLTIFIDAENTLEAQLEFLQEIEFTAIPGSFLDNKILKDLWSGQGKKTGDRSRSGYDFSFCVALFGFGYTTPTVKKLLRKRPGVHKDDETYIAKTVEAARATQLKASSTALPERIVDWSAIEELSREEFIKRLATHLVLREEQLRQFDIFFATIVANIMTKGRPVWLLFIGPPGCGKTLPMMALKYAPYVYMSSAFRSSALISGWGMRGGEDMSLIPKLDGKVLLVKDMSSLLSQHKEVVSEVLSLLRDAYDGSCSKPFGTGVTRTYTSRFGFIGATTPDIDAYWSLNVRLGERFLRYRCRATPEEIYEKIDCALASITDEDSVDLDLENTCMGFLKHLLGTYGEENTSGTLKLSRQKEIGRLAQLGAILRTVVSRSPYGQEVLVIPEWEEATRYAKQLAKMAMSLAYVRGRETNGDEELEVLKILVRDSMDARIEKICGIIYREPGLEANQIGDKISLPAWTVRTCLDNLSVARIVFHQRQDLRLTWQFVPWIEGQLNEFKLWPKEK